MSIDRDAARWRFAVENNCFPVITQGGKDWVVWARSLDHKRRAFFGKSPGEAMDLAMECADEAAQKKLARETE